MVIGESSKTTDLYLNPCIKKQLTNIRAAAADEKIVLSSPKVMGLEEALAYMGDDEIVEVTPGSVRIRKKDLEAAKRGKTAKAKNWGAKSLGGCGERVYAFTRQLEGWYKSSKYWHIRAILDTYLPHV